MMRLFAFAALLAVGCHHSSGGSPPDGSAGDLAPAMSAVTLQPANATLPVMLGSSATLSYKAFDASNNDITSTCQFSVADTTFGAFATTTFTAASRGGVTAVNASCAHGMGTTPLTLSLSGSQSSMSAPANAATLFGAATLATDMTKTPAIEYPIDGAVAPLNLPAIDTQWTAVGNDTFHVSLKSTHLQLDYYTADADAQLDDKTWGQVAATASADSIVITVEGLVMAAPTLKYASTPVTLKISRDTISNTALYYWASSEGDLLTIDFGSTAAPTTVAGGCTACHSVSRAGTRVGYSTCSAGCAGEFIGFKKLGSAGFVDTLDATKYAYDGSYSTFAPVGYPYADDTQAVALVARSACHLSLFDPDKGVPVTSNVEMVSPTDGANPARCATMPDWSPDGKTVVFASGGAGSEFIDVAASALATMSYTYTSGTHTFGTPTFIERAPITLSSGTYDNFFFPSFSPDGAYVVFNAARTAWRGGDEDATGVRLMLTNPTGDFTVDLAKLNGPVDADTTWPHWAPASSTDYYWVVFSTEREYGHKLTQANTSMACVANGVKQCKQIWVGAIDKKTLKMASATSASDPSAPPMWMPGQQIGADNISPYWSVPGGIQ